MGSLAEGKWDQRQDPSHTSNHMWCHPQMESSWEKSGSQEVCVCSGTVAGEDAVPTSLALAQLP